MVDARNDFYGRSRSSNSIVHLSRQSLAGVGAESRYSNQSYRHLLELVGERIQRCSKRQNVVVKISSARPLLLKIEQKTCLKLPIRRFQTPPWCGAPG